jgi:hypothetical protein
MKRPDYGQSTLLVRTAAYHSSPECTTRISETCFRQSHFSWCTAHELMLDEDMVCPQNPSDGASVDLLQCVAVHCG